jgi:hypothetical protein
MSIANIAVGVVADTSKFTPAMKQARHETGLLGGVAEDVHHQLTHLMGAFATGFTIHKFIEEIHEGYHSLIELAHDSKRLGATAGGLGGLEHAAALVRVSSEDLVRSLTFMEKNIGNSKDDIRALGLDFEHLKSLKADQMFLEIAEAIEKLPTAADKTAAVMGIFGKGGAPMLNLIEQGPGKIREAMEEAKGMGLAPDEETIKKIEEADRATRELHEAWKGFTMTLASKTAPALKDIAEMLNGMMGAKTPADRAFDSAIGVLPDKQFHDIVEELKKSGALKDGQLIQGQSLDDVMQKYHLGDKAANAPNPSDVWGTIKSGFRASIGMDPFDQGYNPRLLNSIRDRANADDKAAAEAEKRRKDIDPYSLGKDTLGSIAGDWKEFAMNFTGGAMTTLKNQPAALAYEWGGGKGLLDYLWPDAEKPDKKRASRHSFDMATGAFGQEAGTAAAYSQERRTALQGQGIVEIAKQQLTEQKKQTTQLGKIDASVKQQQKVEVLNL